MEVLDQFCWEQIADKGEIKTHFPQEKTGVACNSKNISTKKRKLKAKLSITKRLGVISPKNRLFCGIQNTKKFVGVCGGRVYGSTRSVLLGTNR